MQLPRFLLALAIVVSSVRAACAATARPDVLLIMPDQFRGDCLSAVGHPTVHTPTLDALAAEGTLFRRAYSTVPSCIPARYAMLTGVGPQQSGVVGFKAPPIRRPTLGGLLSEAGYATELVGRCMHQPEASGTVGYQEEILGSTYVNKDDYDDFLRQAAPQTGGIVKLTQSLGLDPNRVAAKPWPLDESLHPTAWAVQQSRAVLAHASTDTPIFLTTSFFAPHPPLFPPARLFEKYLQADLPSVAMGDWVDKAALSPEGDKGEHRILLEGEKLRRAQAGYFALIEQVDEQIASLIRDFKARSEKAGHEWLIIVTSDHGESLGDHGLARKCEPYEGPANIPLIMAGSARLNLKHGLRNQQVVCLEDILPTIAELAGVPAPEGIDGRSLVAALRGDQAPVRPWLHLEHAPIYDQLQGFFALTDTRMKYIWRPLNGHEQLFDLSTDPREEHDLAPQSSHREELLKWRSRLVEELADRPEGFSDGKQLIAGRPYKPLNSRATKS